MILSELVLDSSFVFVLFISICIVICVIYFIKNADTQETISNINIFSAYNSEIRKVLSEKSTYFKNLTKEEDKNLFIKRVDFFIKTKKFISKSENFIITNEMKILVAATATQLTFGLSRNYFSHFRKIYLFRDIFHNTRIDKNLKGEVSAMGYIALSWNDFVEGYKNECDKLNVGLHEMAHALKLDILFYSNQDTLRKQFLDNVDDKSTDEIAKIKNGDVHFFRDYAATNNHELFAVAVEHFFEAPFEFKERLPLVYKYMSLVLNQDLANNIFRGIKTIEYFKNNNDSNDLEYVSEVPTYKSEVDFFQVFLNVFRLFMFVGIFSISILLNNTNLLLPGLFVVLFAMYFVISLHLNRVIILKDFLIVSNKTTLLKIYKTIHLSNIISVSIENLNRSNFIEIVYVDNKQIVTYKKNIYISEKERQLFAKFLRDKKVLVRENNPNLKV